MPSASQRVRGVVLTAIAGLGLAAVAVPSARAEDGTTVNGRHLQPVGRLTTVGNFPTGGRLTPDGKRFWAVDSGHGKDDVAIVDVASGDVQQVLPLPGAYGAVTFAADGRTAYVSGEKKGSSQPDGPTKGDAGDVVHVFAVDPGTGRATEQDPIALPKVTGGQAQSFGAKEDWPAGLDLTPDGRTLVVALNQADAVAIVDLASKAVRVVKTGTYPYGVAAEDGAAWVTNEYAGTLQRIDLASGTVTSTIGVGGPANPDGGADPNRNAHPEGIVLDQARRRAYVAVANRDLVAVVDTAAGRVIRYVDLRRAGLYGAQPVDVALAPDGRTLYAADSGEDAIAAIDVGGKGNGHGKGSAPSFEVQGRIPTAAYPAGVDVSPDGRTVVWVAAKGFGTGANPAFGDPFSPPAEPYGTYTLDMLRGRVGMLPTPDHGQLRHLSFAADRQLVPTNAQRPAAGTPLRPGGPIKHVFYIVRENRTYDQVFGADARGQGDPSLELLGDNGKPGPTGGITPNAHALSRQFVLLDQLFADSEVSRDGHKITAGGYATDFTQKSMHPNYSGRGRGFNTDGEPAAAPPRDYLFDQAVRQGISFANYGEYAANTDVDDGRPTFGPSRAGKDATYPGKFGCNRAPVTPANCDTDSGTLGTAASQQAPNSRLDDWEADFQRQVADGTVPAFTYLIMPNDHTNGTSVGRPTPQAEVADNDLGVGQLVDIVSHSKIWHDSAIFVVEDDSQNGADSVDAHRIPALVASPWARHGGGVVHTRYDQASVLRSMELILGMNPLSINDALATPMYDAFAGTADDAPYTSIRPEYPLTAVNGAQAADHALSAAMPYNQPDMVPQEISDRILWHSVHGARSRVPHAGPNASPVEHARAVTALRAYRRGSSARAALAGGD